MKVYVLKNFPPLKSLELTSRELMRQVGLLARERIYQRTVGGKDRHGRAFRPYSSSYQARKGAAVGTTGVNLQLSGGMLNALQIADVGDDYVEIGFKA